MNQLIPSEFYSTPNATNFGIGKGTPVARSPGGYGFVLASASTLNQHAFGVCAEDILPSVHGSLILSGMLSLSDWTTITGSSYLQPLGNYYLSSTPGKLTLTPPGVPNVPDQLVGLAASITDMDFIFQTPGSGSSTTGGILDGGTPSSSYPGGGIIDGGIT